MFLTYKERKLADLKRSIIQASTGNEYDCKKCEGTGLSNWFRDSSGDIQWDGISYCNACEGVGKLDWLDKIMGRTKK